MRASILHTGLAATLRAATPLVERQSGFPSSDPNDPCGIQAFGYGPPSTTDKQFAQNPTYQFVSLHAPAPKKYTAAFRNEIGATQQDGYQGYYLLDLYNTTACAENCNNVDGCAGFNTYFERDPLLNPASACPNPVATTNIKYSLYSTKVSKDTATNSGQYREQFHVLIAGSDGFNLS